MGENRINYIMAWKKLEAIVMDIRNLFEWIRTAYTGLLNILES